VSGVNVARDELADIQGHVKAEQGRLRGRGGAAAEQVWLEVEGLLFGKIGVPTPNLFTCEAMGGRAMNVTQLRGLKAEERFRNRLATARAILHSLIGSEVSEGVCQTISAGLRER
jgi:hypothetical protein